LHPRLGRIQLLFVFLIECHRCPRGVKSKLPRNCPKSEVQSPRSRKPSISCRHDFRPWTLDLGLARCR
jgi:hypothetical protein